MALWSMRVRVSVGVGDLGLKSPEPNALNTH